MITRNRGVYQHGKYNEKGLQKQSLAAARNSRPLVKNRNPDLSQLVQSLNFNIFDCLRVKKTKGLIVNFKVEITFRVMNYLVKTFRLNRQFQIKTALFDTLKLINQREIDDRFISVVDKSDFLARVMKKNDINEENVEIRGPCYLLIKFSKHYNVKPTLKNVQ
jgi:hypothetical protein